MPKITLIAAYAARRCIGINNTMPWHLPEDFAFFKSYTTGKPVIMGRKTWESLPRKPLPGRQNIVITRQDYQAEGAQTAASLKDALALCQGVEEVIIMGGAQIYAQALPIATDLRLTEVGLDVDGDAFFPEFSAEQWRGTAPRAQSARCVWRILCVRALLCWRSTSTCWPIVWLPTLKTPNTVYSFRSCWESWHSPSSINTMKSD